MNKFLDNSRTVIAGFLILASFLTFVYFSSSPDVELLAQQRGTISIVRATALPLVNTEGNQVKVVINYSMGSESILGERMNAIMGVYDRLNGSLIKLSSFPHGFIINNTEGTVQLTSTLTDPKIQNISTIVTLTNAEKSEKYSNDVRSDLDLRSILPTSIPTSTLNETLTPLPVPPSSSESNGEDQVESAEDQEEDPSDDDSNSNSE
ncbi:MAG: hypothetical protein WBX01_17250 [Nitrososphaeraceae archaeon]